LRQHALSELVVNGAEASAVGAGEDERRCRWWWDEQAAVGDDGAGDPDDDGDGEPDRVATSASRSTRW
jgi:hypothetical protein